MNVYTDPQLLNMGQAVENLPSLGVSPETESGVEVRTGTDDLPVKTEEPKALTKSRVPDVLSRPVLAKRQAEAVSESVPDEEPADDITYCNRKGLDLSDETGLATSRDTDMVEAAGIEPASRDISERASTCVVSHLAFAPADSGRRDSAFAISD